MTLPLITAPVRGDGIQLRAGLAQAVMIEIDRQPAGRHLLSLPSLEFPLRIDADCGVGAMAESLSINIADTVQRYDAAELTADSTHGTTIETTVRVHRRQIAPIVIEQFCTGIGADTTRTLVVPAALTVNISLRCMSEDAQSVRYVSQPLAIRLVCQSVNDEQSDTAPIQESSAPAERF